MSLNLVALSRQVRDMTDKFVAGADAHRQRCDDARHRYLDETHTHEIWAQLADVSRTTVSFLLAHPLEPLDITHNLPPYPDSYALIATDGSQLEINRHGASHCALVNVGRVFLRYGTASIAKLSSKPTLYYDDENRLFNEPYQQIALKGTYLSARRDVTEIEELVALADEFIHSDIPIIALLEGSLIRWHLAGLAVTARQHFLLPYLEALNALQQRGIPVASYISRPRASDVVGMIRLMCCPDVHPDTRQGAICKVCSDMIAGRAPSCGILHGLTDANVLAGTLTKGQRGPLFRSLSRINIDHYRQHLIHFFYLHVGQEIARVELPHWVAEDQVALNRIHTLIYDQVMRGQGYPVGLARAHEQAVIQDTDRHALLRLVEQSLIRSELSTTVSRKAASKRRQAF